jgi:hypothetical protein
MRIQKSIIVIALAIITMDMSGQKILSIDFDEIKTLTQDSLSYAYYPVLAKRLLEFDKNLTANEYKLLYYGSVFNENYNPYGKSDSENKFTELYKNGKNEEALPYGLKALKENPINLSLIFKLLIIYDQQENKEMVDNYVMIYFRLIEAIYASGTGKSEKTAMVVVCVSDEYSIIADMQLDLVKQALVGDCDKMFFDTKSQKLEKGQKPTKVLYFNVTKPLDYLQNMLKVQ